MSTSLRWIKLSGLLLAMGLSAPGICWAQEPDPVPPPDADADVAEPGAMDPMNAAESELNDERARGHFDAGRSLYTVGDFVQAAEEFDRAYELSGRPQLLYNRYIAHREAGHAAMALEALEGYLDQVPNAADRANLESRLEALRAQVERERALEASTDEAQRQAEEERRLREEQEAAQIAEDEANSPLPWIVASAGAAIMAAGVVTGVLASGSASDIESMCPDNLCPSSYTALEDDRSSARTLVTITDYSLLVGGIILVGGVTWGLLTMGGDDEGVSASAMCGPGGCSGSVNGVF